MKKKRRTLTNPPKPRTKAQPKRIVPKHLPAKNEELPTTTDTADNNPEIDEDNDD